MDFFEPYESAIFRKSVASVAKMLWGCCLFMYIFSFALNLKQVLSTYIYLDKSKKINNLNWLTV